MILEDLGEFIAVQDRLFGPVPNIEGNINDPLFVSDQLVLVPLIRPFCIGKIVDFILKINDSTFKRNLLQKGLYKSPILIHRLYERGFYSIEEVSSYLSEHMIPTALLIFLNYIPKNMIILKKVVFSNSFSKFADHFMKTPELLDDYLKYGFKKGSIEYSIKYDDLSMLKYFTSLPTFQKDQQIDWGYIEWSSKPHSLSMISVSAFFGSINCFKYLMLNGFSINLAVARSAVRGGNFDIIHECHHHVQDISSCMIDASSFMRFDVFEWISSISTNIEPEAILTHSIRVISFFLRNGLDVDYKGNFGITAFHEACSMNNLPLMKFLYDNGANIENINKFDWRPIHEASFNGNFEAVQFLLQYGAEIDSLTNDQKTSLHISSENGFVEIVDLLIQHGAEINKVTYSYTPLTLAISKHHLSVVKLLLSKGADITINNEYGCTPLHLAVKTENTHIVKVLLEYGADIHSTDDTGWSPFDDAENNSLNEIVYLFQNQ